MLLLSAVAVLILAGCGEDSISTEDVDRAEERWAEDAPAAYHWRADGFIDERPVDIDLVVVDGVAESMNGAGFGAEYTVAGLFAQMRAALAGGTSVEGSFDGEQGYPTRVVIADRVDLTTRDFVPIDRPEGCAAEPGSATDLSSEPAAWLLYTRYSRWTDAVGCEVRVDVISQSAGPAHCSWEAATFITVGTPIGAPYSTSDGPADTSRTYIWDPEGVLISIDGINRDVSIPVEKLPETAADAGFRDGDAQLWLDRADSTVLYRVSGGFADRLVIDEPRRFLCQ